MVKCTLPSIVSQSFYQRGEHKFWKLLIASLILSFILLSIISLPIVRQAQTSPTDSIELVSIVPSPDTTLHRGTFVPFEVTALYNLTSVPEGFVGAELGDGTGRAVIIGEHVDISQGSGTTTIHGGIDVDFLYQTMEIDTVYLALSLGYWVDPTYSTLLIWKHMPDYPYLIGSTTGIEVDVDTKYWEDLSYDLRITAQAAPYDVASIRISGPHIDTATLQPDGGDPHYLYDDGKHHDGAANDGLWWALLRIEQPPVIDETITFYITYSDSSSETKQKSIDGVLSETAQLLSPSDGSTVNTLTPKFEWSNPSVSGLTYSVQVNDATQRIYDVYNLPDGTTSHTIPSGYLSWGTEYYWLVSASDANGNEALTNWDTFTAYQLTLLEKYAPVLYLHEYEKYWPWGIYSMLDKAELWEGNYIKVIDSPSPAKLKSNYNDDKYYLNLKGFSPRSGERPPQSVWDNYTPLVYGREYSSSSHIVLQYWFFYPFNEWKINSHEGDWEMGQVVLDKAENPIKLCLAWHHDGNWYLWDDIKYSNIDVTHPKIFITLGGHGCWPTSGDHNLGLESSLLDAFLYDETSENGKVLYPNSVNPSSIKGTKDDDKKLYTFETINTETIWVDWLGKWGQKFLADWVGWNGPKSPANIKYHWFWPKRWEDPIGWCDKLEEGGVPSLSHYIAAAQSTLLDISLHAYDESKLHVGETETGEIEAAIPGTYIYTPSYYSDDQKEWMWIDSSGNVRFEIKARSSGPQSSYVKQAAKETFNLPFKPYQSQSESKFNFAFNRYLKDEGLNITVTYQDVSFTENTIASVDVSLDNPGFIMEIDLNGDGTVDETKEPDVIEGAPDTPTGSIYINNDANYTDSRSVTLTLSANSAFQMCFSNDNSSWSDWEGYSTSRSWTLTSGDGKKTVYVKFRNVIGAQSDVYSDDIILDTTPPTASITSPSADTSVRGSVVIKGTASDENFKEYGVEYGEGTEPSSWTEITSSTSQVTDDTLATWDTTVLDDGSYTLRLTAEDLAGHSAQTQISLRVDNHPPEATLIDYPTETVTGNTPKVPTAFTWTGSDPDGITAVEKLVYQYKLEGHLDYQDWSDWSSGTSKTYMLPSGSYTFKVRAKDEAGNYPDEDDPATARCSFTVSLPIIFYPNPCYPNQGQIVRIVNLPLTSDVKIYIYDLGGNLIRTLGGSEISIEGGSKTATWDLRNDNGELVTRDIYIYFILSATEKKTGKIAIIK